MSLNPFHVAVPVDDLDAARRFYGDLLGCPEGRSDSHWIDFNLYGHQFVCHLSPAAVDSVANTVDGKQVPVPHYGVVLDWTDWQALADRLRAAGISFVLEPGVRFAGQPGEQATFFVADPAGNVLEFKAMRHPDNLFAAGSGQ
jgi:extradiol dioxygenase family protein